MNLETFKRDHLIPCTKPIIEHILDEYLSNEIDSESAMQGLCHLATSCGCFPSKTPSEIRFAYYISYVSSTCSPDAKEQLRAFDNLREFFASPRNEFPLEWVPRQLRTLHPDFYARKEITIIIEN